MARTNRFVWPDNKGLPKQWRLQYSCKYGRYERLLARRNHRAAMNQALRETSSLEDVEVLDVIRRRSYHGG